VHEGYCLRAVEFNQIASEPVAGAYSLLAIGALQSVCLIIIIATLHKLPRPARCPGFARYTSLFPLCSGSQKCNFWDVRRLHVVVATLWHVAINSSKVLGSRAGDMFQLWLYTLTRLDRKHTFA
jgi:hypothetical protein